MSGLKSFYPDKETFSTEFKFDQLIFLGQNMTDQILKGSFIFFFRENSFHVTVSSKETQVTLTVNCREVEIKNINLFLQKFQRFLDEKGIAKLRLEGIEVNFDFEAETSLTKVCQDITAFNELKFDTSNHVCMSFHKYYPVTLLGDLGLVGKQLSSSMTLTVKFRGNQKSRQIPLYDFKIYCKGIERLIKRRQGVKAKALWKTNLVRIEIHLKRNYLAQNQAQIGVIYASIYDEDAEICVIDIDALYYKVAFRFASMASKIRHSVNYDFRTKSFLKEMVEQIDKKLVMKKSQKNEFASYLRQVSDNWLL